jgi:DNA (cytosine-5)-methyltransferase 1
VPLRLLDLFSGIGGFSYAAERIVGGFETVQFVEREPYCQQVLRKHWPHVPIHDDVCTYNPEPGSADVVCGGFPCQDISRAGAQAGISENTRSGLFYELIRIVRVVRPRFVVLENVSAITANEHSSIVFAELAKAGFDAEWACIPASDLGACHRRDRWWCVATSRRPWAGDAAEHVGDAGGAGTVADAIGQHSKRRRDTADMAGATGARQGQVEQWQRDGDAACGQDQGRTVADSPVLRSQEGRATGFRKQQASGRADGVLWRGQGTCWLDPNWREYLSEPLLCRGSDGLRNRVDRLRALGNSVVPQVAAVPLSRVLEISASPDAGPPPP